MDTKALSGTPATDSVPRASPGSGRPRTPAPGGEQPPKASARGEGPRRSAGAGTRSWPWIAARAVLVLLLAASVIELLASSTYRVPGGDVSLRLRPAWLGGTVVMRLGPVGRIEMETHRTPVNLDVGYELTTGNTLGDLGTLERELPAARSSAEKAFRSFALSKLPWLTMLGVVGGLLVVGFRPQRPRGMLLGAAGGLMVIALATGVFAAATYATLDRSPRVAFYGLARDLPRAVSAVGAVSDALKDQDLGFGQFVGALETIGRQLQAGVGPAPPGAGDRIRLLLATDLHLNPVGARLAAGLADSATTPVSALLLGGDMTYFGTAAEARLFEQELGSPGVPVLVVGGNHEASAAMRHFAGLGWTVLDSTVADIEGVRILGFADPASHSAQIVPNAEQMEEEAAAAAAAFAAEQPPPDVVLVHDLAQALPTIAAARAEELPLLVLHGHDHELRVTSRGTVTIVDGGSGGASGVQRLGAAPGTPYTFQIVDFARRDGLVEPVAVTSLSYTGDGSSTADYQPLSP